MTRPVYAMAHVVSGTVTSTPASGPVSAVLGVFGFGWRTYSDGTVVNFGYSADTACTGYIAVADEQAGAITAGAFSGWFRWPLGTAANKYTVCASITGGSPTPASSYTVLSTAQPQVSVSASTFSVGQQTNVIGNHYVPGGISVSLAIQPSGGGNSVSLGNVISDVNGNFTLNFIVPSNPTGSVMIVATSGAGNPATLSASVAFTIQAAVITPTPTAQPSPTPTPKPSPTPTATPTSAVTPTPTVTATATADTTPTAQTTTTPDAAQTVTPASTPISNNTPGGTDTNTTGSSILLNIALITGLIILFVAALFVGALVWRRRNQKAPANQSPNIPAPIYPTAPGMMDNQNPVSFTPVPANGGVYPMGMPVQPTPVPFEAGMQVNNVANNPQTAVPPPMATAGTNDPDIVAMLRQAQGGLFVLPEKNG